MTRRAWHDFQLDLVGDNSDAPRLPDRQLHVLHRIHPERLSETERSRAWSMLLASPSSGRPRRHPIDTAGRWGRRFGLTVGLLVSVLVAQVLALATGAPSPVLPLVVGAVFGEAAGLGSAHLFVALARAEATSVVGGRD